MFNEKLSHIGYRLPLNKSLSIKQTKLMALKLWRVPLGSKMRANSPEFYLNVEKKEIKITPELLSYFHQQLKLQLSNPAATTLSASCGCSLVATRV